MIFFPNWSGVRGVTFPANSITPNDPIIKTWEYGMVAYLMKIPYLKYPCFSRVTKFQQYMVKRIHWIITSPNGPTKIS